MLYYNWILKIDDKKLHENTAGASEYIVTRLVTVDGYWIDNWIYYSRTLKYNTTESLRTPSVLQLTTHSLTH
jgi:hypothetical protein